VFYKNYAISTYFHGILGFFFAKKQVEAFFCCHENYKKL